MRPVALGVLFRPFLRAVQTLLHADQVLMMRKQALKGRPSMPQVLGDERQGRQPVIGTRRGWQVRWGGEVSSTAVRLTSLCLCGGSGVGSSRVLRGLP